jgi:hypothetical protein
MQPTNLPLDDSQRRMQRIFDISPPLPSRHIVRRIINCLTTSSPLAAHNQFSIFKALHAHRQRCCFDANAALKRGAFCAWYDKKFSLHCLSERLLSFSFRRTEYVLVSLFIYRVWVIKCLFYWRNPFRREIMPPHITAERRREISTDQ